MNLCSVMLISILLLPALVVAEIYAPPANVRDPARKPMASSDPSLPFIYLEPHDCCYDITKPLPVTLSAVNRSGAKMTIDWRAIVGSLVLQPVGPGHVVPARHETGLDTVALAPRGLAQVTIDLKDLFDIQGAAVYRLSYVRPLKDGRVHVAVPVQFVIEEDATLNRIAVTLGAMPARSFFVALLKDNPMFVAGGEAKTYGWDKMEWRDHARMHRNQWDEVLAAARERWRRSVIALAQEDADPSDVLDALLDRLLFISDRFRAAPKEQFVFQLDKCAEHMLPKQREQLLLKLVRTRSKFVVAHSMNRLMSLRSELALPEFFRIGDGPDHTLAYQAIGALSSFRRNPRIAQYLRRKMADDDRALALRAAIVSCYSGDWSGIGLLLRSLKSDDPALRLKALGQVVESRRFGRYRDQIVRSLLDELKNPMSEAHLVRALESLGAYPSDEVLEAVRGFLEHENPRVARRAKMSVRVILREKAK